MPPFLGFSCQRDTLLSRYHNSFGTTVTMPVDTVIPCLLSHQYHSFGTSVTIALEQSCQQPWNSCDNGSGASATIVAVEDKEYR